MVLSTKIALNGAQFAIVHEWPNARLEHVVSKSLFPRSAFGIAPSKNYVARKFLFKTFYFSFQLSATSIVLQKQDLYAPLKKLTHGF